MHIIRSNFGLICLAACLFANSAQAEYTALKPGLWEVSTTTRMKSMPVELPAVPYSTTHCLTQQQLNNQQNLSTVVASQGACEIRNPKITERKTSWDMTCERNNMQVEASGVITPMNQEFYTGKVDFTMRGSDMPSMRGEAKVQGVWLGECNKSSQHYIKPRYRNAPPILAN